MGNLIYSFLASVDGYIADEAGRFDWAVPDEEVLDFINDAEQEVRTYRYGRTIYEMMTGWELSTISTCPAPPSLPRHGARA